MSKKKNTVSRESVLAELEAVKSTATELAFKQSFERGIPLGFISNTLLRLDGEVAKAGFSENVKQELQGKIAERATVTLAILVRICRDSKNANEFLKKVKPVIDKVPQFKNEAANVMFDSAPFFENPVDVSRKNTVETKSQRTAQTVQSGFDDTNVKKGMGCGTKFLLFLLIVGLAVAAYFIVPSVLYSNKMSSIDMDARYTGSGELLACYDVDKGKFVRSAMRNREEHLKADPEDIRYVAIYHKEVEERRQRYSLGTVNAKMDVYYIQLLDLKTGEIIAEGTEEGIWPKSLDISTDNIRIRQKPYNVALWAVVKLKMLEND